jgi:hypothetical protein
MRPLSVVVRGILGKHSAEMPLAEDQHAVGHFRADGQREAFGEAVRPRAPRRILTTSIPASAMTASKESVNPQRKVPSASNGRIRSTERSRATTRPPGRPTVRRPPAARRAG